MEACIPYGGCLSMIALPTHTSRPWLLLHAPPKQALLHSSRCCSLSPPGYLCLNFAAKLPWRTESSSSRRNKGAGFFFLPVVRMAGPTRSAMPEVDDQVDGVAGNAVGGNSSAGVEGNVPGAEHSDEVGSMAISATEPAGDVSIGEELQQKESFDSQENMQKMPRQLGTERLVADASDFWQGVVEETRLIEWPSFQKVVGTTGVVLGIIVGSSLVLLTVNAILAELSDSVFNNPDIIEGAKSYLNGS
eukprot:c24204_g1_i1 orf=214-954(+)